MKLAQELRGIADYTDKCTYEQIVDLLKEQAHKGEYEAYIPYDEVYSEDMERLQNEECLEMEVITNKTTDTGTWRVTW